MTTDERLSPTFEDMILLIVLGLLDARLPKYVKSHYALKMENSRLMDFKADIFANIIKFVDQIDTLEQFSAFKVETPNLAAFNKFNKNCDASTNFRRNPGRARCRRRTPSASPARTATRASLSTAATVRGTRSAPARRSSTPSTATTSSRRSCKTLISLLESRRRSVQ